MEARGGISYVPYCSHRISLVTQLLRSNRRESHMSDKGSSIAAAIIGVLGSIAVALITTNATFDNRLSSEQEAIAQLQKKIEEMEAEFNPITLHGNGDATINGQSVAEIESADKRFYQQQCKLGKVSHAVLNTNKAGKNIKQPALCTCSEHPVGGRGWICFD